MACGSELRRIREDDGLEGLGVDSGMLAIVDAAASDRFLDEVRAWYDGSLPPFGPEGVGTADGVLLDAGGDDVYPCEAAACDVHAHAFYVELEEPTDQGRWQHIGQLPVPSGLLLVGDPGMVQEYAPYLTTGPVDARGVWTALAMSSGRVDVHVLRDQGPGHHRNQVIRINETW